MADTTPAAFDPKPKQLGPVRTFIAGAAILAGQLVGVNNTGVTDTVHPTADGSIDNCVGVALHSQASTGGYVAVAGNGTWCKLCSGDANALEAGDPIMLDGVAGCVVVGSDAADDTWVGYATEAITGNLTGYCVLQIQYVPKGA